jgi:hypothetical protein
MSTDSIIEGIIGIAVLIIMLPALIGLIHIIPSTPTTDHAAEQRAQNLSEQLQICQTNLDALNKTVVTKGDLKDILSAIQNINTNVINLYDTQNNYIENRFQFIVSLSVTLTLGISITLFTFIDITIFGGELWKAIWGTFKKRFKRG